ncbi:hypothetical protein Bca52824_023751 [Brassica carinata]|uniref:Non-haem dioxygenase N-terminal domain-containing protein n=1 Tax=Brassica carinata TaxID=52824 RepID=A0A8X7VIW1_BRACI|nr:hypothetical protein Bca52824_023751 [Brassica carinata]
MLSLGSVGNWCREVIRVLLGIISSRHSSRYVPYEKKQSQSWRAKVVEEAHVVSTRSEQESYARSSPPDRVAKSVTGMMDHPYPQNSGKRLASQVVTPNGVDQDVNVTKRRRDVTRVLSFSPKEDVLPMDAQVIDALNDMEILESSKLKDGMMMIDDQEDDLLGDELMELESEGHKEVEVTHKEYNVGTERDTASFNNLSGTEVSSSHKGGRRLGIPLGLPNRKAEFLRRGSPKLRGSKVREIHRSGKQHRSLTSKASATVVNGQGAMAPPPNAGMVCEANLGLCAAALKVGTKPSDECCTSLDKAVKTQFKCLCAILTNPQINGEEREKTLSDIAKACEEWGFFQLVSHGTPLELLNKVKELSSDCYKTEREEAFKTSTPVKLLNELLEKNSGEKLESVDWEDVFTLLDHNQNEWPSNTSGLKETMLEYIGEVMKLASKMMEVMD